jgi:hypothetical protein
LSNFLVFFFQALAAAEQSVGEEAAEHFEEEGEEGGACSHEENPADQAGALQLDEQSSILCEFSSHSPQFKKSAFILMFHVAKLK